MSLSKITVDNLSDDAITLDISNNIIDARNTLMKYNISRVVITADKMPVGMVTEKDIVRFVYSSNLRKSPYNIRLGQIIENKTPITVEDNMNLTSCINLMLSKNIQLTNCNLQGF